MKYLVSIFLFLTLATAAIGQEIKSQKQLTLLPREEAKFPGGDEEMVKYFMLNLRYPTRAFEESISGEVIVSFLIDEKGEISDAKVIKGLGYGCDEEAIRVVHNMPQWKPARMKGKPVRVMYKLPIVFELPEKRSEKD
jgi:TonB family protein